jgi:hypothetical protein
MWSSSVSVISVFRHEPPQCQISPHWARRFRLTQQLRGRQSGGIIRPLRASCSCKPCSTRSPIGPQSSTLQSSPPHIIEYALSETTAELKNSTGRQEKEAGNIHISVGSLVRGQYLLSLFVRTCLGPASCFLLPASCLFASCLLPSTFYLLPAACFLLPDFLPFNAVQTTLVVPVLLSPFLPGYSA